MTKKEHCKKYDLKIKLKCFALFDNKCCRCGFTDIRALQIDHKDGAKEKQQENQRGGNSLYRAIVLGNRYINEFQLLCANCNWIKRHENKEHANYINSKDKP